MLDFEHLNHYAILELSRNAKNDDIKRAYRREMSKYHPDRFVNASAEEQRYASLRSQRINEAYSVLSDFLRRSEYDRGIASPQLRSSPAPAHAAASPASSRDYQAELYEQAQLHLDAGRPLQALAALRQLQKINPFYRDSNVLLARAKQAVEHQQPSRPPLSKVALIVASIGGVALLAAALFLSSGWSKSGVTASKPTLMLPSDVTTPVKAIVATVVPEITMPPEPSVEPQPTAEPQPSATPEATATLQPSATPKPTSTAVPTLPAQGELVLRDTFTNQSWAQLAGTGWRVGYDGNQYRIDAEPGYGFIWSYRSGPEGKRSYTIDMQVSNGEAGLMLRFNNEISYIAVLLDQAQGRYRVLNKNSRIGQELVSGSSLAIQQAADAMNRLEVRIDQDQLTILINGQQVESLSVAVVPDSNRYGLIAVAGDSPAFALFDNLEIRVVNQ